MSFAYPVILLLLWLVPLPGLLIVWARRRQQRRTARLIHPNALKGRLGSRSEFRFYTQLALFITALILFIIASAGPRWGQRDEIVLGSGRNVLIVLDVSRSMLADDVRPNRLERAKADLTDLLADLQGDRAGIMVFRNGTAMLCPFTTDLAFLNQTLTGITVDSAPRGETDIGEAISSALNAFKDLGADHNAIILISDGEDLSGKAVSAAAEAGKRNIPVFCVGIGNAKGSTIPGDETDVMKYKGENVVTKLNNQTLLDMATASKGAYIPLETAATGRTTLGTLYNRHVRTIVAQEIQEMRESRMIERFQLFLIPGVLLLIVCAALSYGRPGKRCPIKKTAVAALVLLLPLFAPAETTNNVPDGTEKLTAQEIGRQAQRAWKKGDYATAADRYQTALSKEPLDPELAETLRFNAALSFLKAGNSGKAAEIFRQLATGRNAESEAAEGLGVSLFRAAEALSAVEKEEPKSPSPVPDTEKASEPKRNLSAEKLKLFEEAATAFQQALRGLPDDDLRKQNLRAAIAGIPKLREDARLADIMGRYGEMSPEQLVPKLLELQRGAYAASTIAFTNNSPDQIKQLENTAQKQREAADIWMPLHQKMMEAAQKSITNANELADFKFQLDKAKDQAEGAATALENLDPAAIDAMRESERSGLQLLAMVTPPPVILAESILSQSNALDRVVNNSRPRTPVQEQQIAQGLFKVFSERYGQWLDQLAQQQPQQQQQPTQAPGPRIGPVATPPQQPSGSSGVTPEVRKEIDDLVNKTLGSHALVQMDQAKDSTILSDKARVNAAQALKDMTRIMELLPKPPQDKQKQQKQDQQQNQKDQQDQQKQDQQKQDEQNKQDKQDQQNEQKQDEKKPEDKQQQQDQQQKEDEKKQEAQAQQAEESPDKKDAENVMAKILEQEKQRNEDRQNRQRTMPPRVGERDW